jgi:hypothetical protein
MSNRDRAIIAQTSAKVAGELCHGKGMAGLNEYLACSEMIFNDIIDKAGEVGAATPPAAVAPAVQGIPAPPVMAAAAPPAAQVQAAFPGAAIVAAPGGDVMAPAAMPFPAPAAARPAGRARKKMQLDGNGFVTDDKQAAWNVAFLCAGEKTDDGKLVVFDNKFKKTKGAANIAAGLPAKHDGGYEPTASDFVISDVGALKYGLGAKRISLWLSDAPTNIQAGDGSILPFNVADMHARCGG